MNPHDLSPSPASGTEPIVERRRRFPHRSKPEAALMLRVLQAQDGSMTRVCEAVAGVPVEIRIVRQTVTAQVHRQVGQLLHGQRFLERITSLVAHYEVLTDNLVYVALDGLDRRMQTELEAGVRPIGHLLSNRWTRRETVHVEPAVLERLWQAVGVADPDAMRCYRLETLDGPTMLVCETFRDGLWRAPYLVGSGAA